MFFFLIKVENSEWTRTEFHRWAFHSKTRVSTLWMNYIMPWQVHHVSKSPGYKGGQLTTFLALNLAGFFAICTLTVGQIDCNVWCTFISNVLSGFRRSNWRSSRFQFWFWLASMPLCVIVFWLLPCTVTNVFCLMFSSTRDTFIPELLSISKFLL